MCEFENIALDIVHSVLSYEHVIIFHAILQKNEVGPLNYITLENISMITNLHHRDVMKYLGTLIRNKFVDTYIRTVNKRRISYYGINYIQFMNFSFITLKTIRTQLGRKHDFYCESCKRNLNVDECLDNSFQVSCPFNKSHILTKNKSFETEKKKIENIMRRIEEIKYKKPVRDFVRYFKRTLDDCSQTTRVVVRKS